MPLFLVPLTVEKGTSGMARKKDNFNPAFKDLRVKWERARRKAEDAHGSPAIPRTKEERGEDRVFLEAMSDVIPLEDDKRKVPRRTRSHPRPSHPAPDDEQAAMNHLHGLVRGVVEMDMTFTDEYMEGCVKGFSRRLMKKLKRGEFPVQDFIDLHGLTRREAEEAVRGFLIQSHRVGLRCVLIVHGRGLNSPDSFPVLKEGLPLWLGKGAIRKVVLAFATARPYDGGTGAIYVLLRRR